ncbi:hypothetical protein WJX73_002417 [Symbiochloris irregularis]|uniref:Actin-related protein 4 n=1 Tax=Symbiochloris irregularis TaxID=706552 RepID=A0AAW1NV77_9CHLO
MMNGGDEVNALVIDLGSSTAKAGYAGDDTPKCYFPSFVGNLPAQAGAGTKGEVKREADANGADHARLLVGNNAVDLARDYMEVQPVVRHGAHEDWGRVEAVLEHIFRDHLNVNPAEHPILMAEPSFATDKARERMVELLFEKHSPPALFLGKNAMLTSFAVGRQTSLVVDAGHEATVVAAVHDGYVLKKSIVQSPLGGQLLTRCMKQAVLRKGVELHPQTSLRRLETVPGKLEVKFLSQPHVTDSFRQYHVEALAADIKETTCRVSDVRFSSEENANIPTVSYELPDGNEIQIGPERFGVPELLFQPSLISTFEGQAFADATKMRSLPEAVLDSINQCDVDVRRDLFSGIVLTGGSSLLVQLRERLERELSDRAPPTAKVKVTAPTNSLERRFSVWIGASILASLGSFQQMWLSKMEYDEHGAAMIHKKSP